MDVVMTLSLLACGVPILLIVYGVMRYYSRAQGGLLFGARVEPGWTEEPEVRAIRKTFVRQMNRYALLLLVLQLGLMQAKTNARAAAGLRLTCDRSDEYFALLPFAPTNAQRRAVHECVTDMTGASPMSRLLQGDVGSGKTAVAALGRSLPSSV